jgi:hypothetical protein
MSHTHYIIGILLAGILSLTGWFLVLFRLDPFSSTNIALILFFVSLFFALASFFTVIGYYLRVFFNKNEIYYAHILISLREGILFGFFVCITLIFQIIRVLTWWNLLLLFLAIMLLEVYFLSRGNNP